MTSDKPKRIRPPRHLLVPLTLLFILSVFYYYLMQPSSVRGLIQTIFEDYTGARIELEVRRASLLYGFDFRDIRLIDTADQSPLFTANRLRLSWFLPSLLIGHVGIRELALDDPHLYLVQRNGRWNWSSVVSPDPEKDEDRDLPPELDLFLTFQVYANLQIKNFALTLHRSQERTADRPADEFRLELTNVNLRFAAITRPFSTIPLDLKLLDLFDTLLLALNPYEPVGIRLRSGLAAEKSPGLSGRARLTYFLFRETQQGITEFASRMLLDTAALKVERAGQTSRSPGIALRYDTSYDAHEDRLLIPIVEVRHGNERWLSMNAEVKNAATPRRTLRLDVRKSKFDLRPVGHVLSTVLGNGKGPIIDGQLTIAALGLQGSLDRLSLVGQIEAQQLRIAPGSGIDVLRDFKLDVSALVDLYQVLPFVDKPADYAPDKSLAFGIFHRLNVPELRAVYGRTRLTGNAAIQPDTGVLADLDVQGFTLESVLPDVLRGRVDAKLQVRSPENFLRMDFDGSVRLRDGRYFLERSRSGEHDLNLKAKGALLFDDDFSVDLREVQLDGWNPNGDRMLALLASGRLRFGDAQVYDIDVKRMAVNYEALHPVFPGSIRYIMLPYKIYLSQGVRLRSAFEMRIFDDVFALKIRRGSTLAIPFLRLDDLDLEADLQFGEKSMRARSVHVRGLRGALAIDASADLHKNAADRWQPRAKLNLRVARDSLLRVHENIALQGTVRLDAEIDDELAKGRLKIENLDVEYDEGACQTASAGPGCYRLAVSKFNLDIPFEHELTPARILSLSDRAGRDYRDTYGLTGQPNLSIRSVASSHKPNGEFAGQTPDQRYYYVGQPGVGQPAVIAKMNYRNNILLADWLRLVTYRRTAPAGKNSGSAVWKNSGTVDGRSLYFNLADLKTENMECGLNLQMQDLDLEPFLPGRNRYQAEISGDLKWNTSSLKDFLYNTEALASIHKIQDDFSGFITRILLPTQVAALLVNNTVSIPRIRAELKGGLVYSYVSVRRGGALGYLVKPGGDEIKQERMPIVQFLDRARSELGTRAQTAGSPGGQE